MAKTYSTSIDLRFSDFDMYGHVNSAVYFTYIELARIKLLNSFFMDDSQRGLIKVVARAECNYKIPILLSDELVITLWVSKIGFSSFDIEYRLHDNNERTFATARTTMVCIDTKKNATTSAPEILKTLLR